MVSNEDIKAARLAVGESQSAFAKRFGVRQATLSRWETGVLVPQGPAKLIVERVLAELSEVAA